MEKQNEFKLVLSLIIVIYFRIRRKLINPTESIKITQLIYIAKYATITNKEK